jgi:hypothetical protein
MGEEGDDLGAETFEQSESPAIDETAETASIPPLSAERILPAIAIFGQTQEKSTSKNVVLYVSAERFIWGTMAKSKIVPEAAAEPGDGYLQLRATLEKKGHEFLPQEITKIEMGDTGTYGSPWKLNFSVGHLLRISISGKTLEWILPEDSAEIMAQAFQMACPDRFDRVPSVLPMGRHPLHEIIKSFLWILPFLLISFPLMGNGFLHLDSATTSQGIATTVALVTGVLEIALLIFALIRLIGATLRRRKHFRKATPKVDLSNRKPISKPILGAVLKYGGGLVFVIVYLGSLFFPINTLFPQLQEEGANLSIYLTLLIYMVIAAVIFVGYRLSLASAEQELSSDHRPPILYLRAFEDDGGNSYNPTGGAANLLGLRAAHFLLNANPMRVIRMVLRRPADTAEEQMANFVSRYGPFVAIGKPGEQMRQGGAARLYVPDHQWQQTVLDFIERSQFIVLQPAETSGVWWEVERMLERANHNQVLLALANFINKPNRYTLFRWRFEQTTGRELPRSMADSAFCRFQEDWQPQMLPARYFSPFLWPVQGCGLNFKKTLGPFLAALKGAAVIEPLGHDRRSFRWIPRFLAVCLWLSFFGLAGFLAAEQGTKWRVRWSVESALAKLHVSTFTDHNIDPDYHVHLSDIWTGDNARPGFFALNLNGETTATTKFEVDKKADLESDNNTPETRAAAEQKTVEQDSGETTATLSSRDVTEGNRVWRERRFTVDQINGIPNIETVAVTEEGDDLLVNTTLAQSNTDNLFTQFFAEARQGLIQNPAPPPDATAAAPPPPAPTDQTAQSTNTPVSSTDTNAAPAMATTPDQAGSTNAPAADATGTNSASAPAASAPGTVAFTDYDLAPDYVIHLSDAWKKDPTDPTDFNLNLDGQTVAFIHIVVAKTADLSPDRNTEDTLTAVEQKAVGQSIKATKTLSTRDFQEGTRLWKQKEFAYVETDGLPYVMSVSVAMEGDDALVFLSWEPQVNESAVEDYITQARQSLTQKAADTSATNSASATAPADTNAASGNSAPTTNPPTDTMTPPQASP